MTEQKLQLARQNKDSVFKVQTDPPARADAGIDKVRIWVQGQPTTGIALAHRIATAIFTDAGPWHFTSISLTPPFERGLGYRLDSRWAIECTAELKPAGVR